MVTGFCDKRPSTIEPISTEGGSSPLTPSLTWDDCLEIARIDSLHDNPVPKQAVILPTPQSAGEGPAGVPLAWYPDIQPFNISQATKVTPGYGEKHENCGTVRFKILCGPDPSHYQTLARHQCRRPACPSCWPSWAARSAKSTAETIEGYRSVARTKRNARHVSLHPAPDQIPHTEPTPEALQWLYDEGRKIATILGITAAAVVPHPYRIRPEHEAAVSEAARAKGLNRYAWALQQPNWSDLVYFSPHLHIIAYGPLKDSIQFYRQTGWTYRNHDAGTPNSGRTGGDLRKTLFYLLSHAWVGGNHKIVRYWLGMSTHQLKRVDEGYTVIPVVCPVCAADCVCTPPDIVWADGSTHHVYQDLRNAPPATRKMLHFHFEARPRKTHRAPRPRQTLMPQGVITA